MYCICLSTRRTDGFSESFVDIVDEADTRDAAILLGETLTWISTRQRESGRTKGYGGGLWLPIKVHYPAGI
jgi:hypothetical protein